MVRNRGQLLLIAAVLLGMTIIGTVVMLNGMQYVDAAGAQSQSQVIDDADRTEEMVERDMKQLVNEVNESNETALDENISTYSNYSRNLTASRGEPMVIVELNDSSGPILVDYKYRSEKLAYNRTISIDP